MNLLLIFLNQKINFKIESIVNCFNKELGFILSEQGCQMVYFQTKNPNLGKFSSVLQRKMLVYIFYVQLVYVPAIWSILCSFGSFYVQLVFFTATW
jgi:hypothetical protein